MVFRGMAFGRVRLAACLAAASVLVGACSSSSPSAQSPSPSTPSVTSTSGGSAVQSYLDAVNRLCTALLPKVIAVTHGGSLDVPVKKYFAQQPAHAKLLAGFDRQLARVPVPAAAKDKAAVFAAYVRFANRLDAKRLAAAKQGQAAYAKEVKSEASIESDPAITALIAAGFDQSCEAR
jgi:ABC-type Fe3+-hydroxamate transport system substrate-binding protein